MTRRVVPPAALPLLLTGAYPLPAPRLAALLASLPAEAWATFLAQAQTERLLTLVAAHLAGQGLLDRVPPTVRTALEAEQRRNLVAVAQQTYALDCITRQFAADRIPFRVLKGLALARQLYTQLATRPVGDIDLWVRPADVPRATAALGRLGLVQTADYYGRPAAFLRAFAAEQEFVPATSADLPAQVDLHWHLVAPWWLREGLRVPEAALFARPASVPLGALTYATLPPTAAFYYLCLHAGINHRFQGLRWLIDLQVLLRSGQVAWPALNALADGSGGQMIVWCSLALLDRMGGSRYRTHLHWQPGAGARWAARRAFPFPPPAPDPAVAVQSAPRLPLLVLLPGPGPVARAIARLLWPAAGWLRLRYGAAGGRIRLRHLLGIVRTRSTN